VVIATRDRRDSLEETLRSIEAVSVPPDRSHEVIVVDNGSRDGTAELLAAAARRATLPLVAMSVPQPGKSRSLNRAIEVARGRVLLFTDDDVRCPQYWISGMTEPILSESADAVAGRVVLPTTHLEAMRGTLLEPRPGWVADTHYIDFDDPKSLVGANMAIGRHVFDRLGGFDEALGPGASETGLGEETLLCCRILDAGLRIVGAPEVAVEHHFDLSRLDDDAVLEIGRKLAKSGAYMNWHWYRRGGWIRPWTIPKELLKRWIRNTLGPGRTMSDLGHRTDRLEAESRLTYLHAYRRFQRQPRKYTPRSLGNAETPIAHPNPSTANRPDLARSAPGRIS
jgi:glycosyltransferase involved in cell wall biosynthesis